MRITTRLAWRDLDTVSNILEPLLLLGAASAIDDVEEEEEVET